MSHFVYKLVPPRPTFDTDMSDDEAAVMGQHGGYWQERLENGRVVVFGPVSDPTGTWGLAVFEAKTEDEARAIGADDPAVNPACALSTSSRCRSRSSAPERAVDSADSRSSW